MNISLTLTSPTPSSLDILRLMRLQGVWVALRPPYLLTFVHFSAAGTHRSVYYRKREWNVAHVRKISSFGYMHSMGMLSMHLRISHAPPDASNLLLVAYGTSISPRIARGLRNLATSCCFPPASRKRVSSPTKLGRLCCSSAQAFWIGSLPSTDPSTTHRS